MPEPGEGPRPDITKDKTTLTRRQFLKRTVTAGGLLASEALLAGCTPEAVGKDVQKTLEPKVDIKIGIPPPEEKDFETFSSLATKDLLLLNNPDILKEIKDLPTDSETKKRLQVERQAITETVVEVPVTYSRNLYSLEGPHDTQLGDKYPVIVMEVRNDKAGELQLVDTQMHIDKHGKLINKYTQPTDNLLTTNELELYAQRIFNMPALPWEDKTNELGYIEAQRKDEDFQVTYRLGTNGRISVTRIKDGYNP